ncbi:thioredoxin family protein [Litorivivens sp.]|uniref:thioredoxin family protein n=1 Tax=Litorivivens sp. TaxID=2020868 RepID=UPI003561D014
MSFDPTYHDAEPTLSELQAGDGYLLLEFGAPWCGHCQAAAPAVATAMTAVDVPHIKIYDGKGKRLGRAFGVKLWPTLILLNNGEEVARLVRPRETEAVARLLASIEG